MEIQDEDSLKKKVHKLDMIEDVYVITTFFITVALVFLMTLTLPDLLEIIQIKNLEEFTENIYRIAIISLIYLIFVIEIIGFLAIHHYNRKHSQN